MITVCAMTEADLDELTPYLHSDIARQQIAYRLTCEGFNKAMRVDGKLIACGGVQTLWPGVAEAWFWGTPLLPAYRFSAYKVVMRHILSAEIGGLWRIECMVCSDFAAAIRFVTRLGFQYEGTKRQAGPNREDYHLYALLRDKEAQP